jgi:hypothetical protein
MREDDDQDPDHSMIALVILFGHAVNQCPNPERRRRNTQQKDRQYQDQLPTTDH